MKRKDLIEGETYVISRYTHHAKVIDASPCRTTLRSGSYGGAPGVLVELVRPDGTRAKGWDDKPLPHQVIPLRSVIETVAEAEARKEECRKVLEAHHAEAERERQARLPAYNLLADRMEEAGVGNERTIAEIRDGRAHSTFQVEDLLALLGIEVPA